MGPDAPVLLRSCLGVATPWAGRLRWEVWRLLALNRVTSGGHGRQAGNSVFLVWNMTDVDTQQGLLSLGGRVGGSSARQEKEAEGTWEGVKSVETSTPGLPRPLLFVRCPLCFTSGSRACINVGRRARNREGSGELTCFVCLLSLKFVLVHLSSLCSAFTVCPSVCLWVGREGKGVSLPQILGLHPSLGRSPVTDLCPHPTLLIPWSLS